jgi:hypothetical protein
VVEDCNYREAFQMTRETQVAQTPLKNDEAKKGLSDLNFEFQVFVFVLQLHFHSNSNTYLSNHLFLQETFLSFCNFAASVQFRSKNCAASWSFRISTKI